MLVVCFCGQSQASLAAELGLVLCLYRQRAAFTTALTPSFTKRLWHALLLLALPAHHCTPDTHAASGATGSAPVTRGGKRRGEDCPKGSRGGRKVPRLAMQTSVLSDADPTQPDAGSVEAGVVDVAVCLLTSQPLPVFGRLLEGVASAVGRDLPVSPTQESVIRRCLLVIQKLVLCSTLDSEQLRCLQLFSSSFLQQCVRLTQQLHAAPGAAARLATPLLHCLTAMLTTSTLLSGKGTLLCLSCVGSLAVGEAVDTDFVCLVPAACGAVHAALVYHPRTALHAIETCLAIVSHLVKECVRRGDQRLLLTAPALAQGMLTCAALVNRLLTLLASHQKDLQRVAITLISDYAIAVKSVTLLPAIKKSLLSGVYVCLDICDKHAIDQLRLRLPAGVREVFHLLYQDYVRHHKYTGKV